MEALITKEQIIENIDRASLAYEAVLTDPEWSSWPNAYREWVLKIHSTYVAAQALGLQEGTTYPPAPEPEPKAYKRAAYALVHVGQLLVKKPGKINNRRLDVAAMEAGRLLIQHRVETGREQYDVNVQEFERAKDIWCRIRPKLGGTFPDRAVATEIPVAQRFGYRKPMKRARPRGTTALTFNEKNS